jgi:hypothetical protein
MEMGGKYVSRLNEQSKRCNDCGNSGRYWTSLNAQFNTSNLYGNSGNFDIELYDISKLTKDKGNLCICLMELQLHQKVSIVSGNDGS